MRKHDRGADPDRAAAAQLYDEAAGKGLFREELLSAVWGFDSEVETRVTDETLRRIRKKLTQAGSTISVSTIWGFGYKLKGAECT